MASSGSFIMSHFWDKFLEINSIGKLVEFDDDLQFVFNRNFKACTDSFRQDLKQVCKSEDDLKSELRRIIDMLDNLKHEACSKENLICVYNLRDLLLNYLSLKYGTQNKLCLFIREDNKMFFKLRVAYDLDKIIVRTGFGGAYLLKHEFIVPVTNSVFEYNNVFLVSIRFEHSFYVIKDEYSLRSWNPEIGKYALSVAVLEGLIE